MASYYINIVSSRRGENANATQQLHELNNFLAIIFLAIRMSKSRVYKILGNELAGVNEEGWSSESEKKCSLKPWQRWLLIGGVVLVVLVVVAMLISVVVILVDVNKAAAAPTEPTAAPTEPTNAPNTCKAAPPLVKVACASSAEKQCIDVGCCWYEGSPTPCYNPNPMLSCPTDASSRESCVAATEALCTAASCCWDTLVSHCFKAYNYTCPAGEAGRINCIPDYEGDSRVEAHSLCDSRVCCWSDTSFTSCALPNEYGYFINGSVESTSLGLSASITRNSQLPSLYGGDVNTLNVDVTYETESRVRVQVYLRTTT